MRLNIKSVGWRSMKITAMILRKPVLQARVGKANQKPQRGKAGLEGRQAATRQARAAEAKKMEQGKPAKSTKHLVRQLE
jgi:hypothetical protein